MRRPKLSTLGSLAALALVSLVALLGAGAGAGEGQPVLFIRSVDSSDPAATEVQFVYSGAPEDLSGATLDENDTPVSFEAPASFAATERVDVALLFDTSDPMDTSGALVAAKEAAKDWIRGRTPEQQSSMRFAVYAMAETGTRLQGFTANEERLINAIDKVAPPTTEAGRASTAMWNAVRIAADDLAESTGQANIAIFAAQDDNVSGGEQSSASGAVSSAQASVFAAEFVGDGMTGAGIESLVDKNGGQILTTEDGTQMGGLVSALAATVTDGQYLLTYPSAVPVGEVSDLVLRVGEVSDEAASVSGSLTDGVPALHAEVTSSSGGIEFLQSNLGLLITVVLVLIAVGGIAYGLTLVFVKDDELATVLQPYDEPSFTDEETSTGSIVKTPFVQRAVELTEQVAADRGLLARAENALERANLPLRAGEALFFYAAIVVVATFLGLALFGGILGALILGAIAAIVPVVTVNVIAGLRKRKFMAQLPDTLQLLSGTLRAGYSLMQGVEAVSQEVDEPMGLELRRVVTESRLGRPLEEALEGTAERMDSPDFGWAVMAIRIQREVGGNLAELLLTVAETMTARERLRRDVAALTAEGRVSAVVLAILPVGLAFAMYVLSPEYITRLFDTTIGNILLVASGISMLVGFFWMKKIIDIEI